MNHAKPVSTQIKYKVLGCSEHSGRYVADNIRYDRPHDQTSRWSSAKDNSIHGKSWILVELESAALLESITFGKYHKAHPCNLKDFEVHIGMSKDCLTEVLKGYLKNDSNSETFPLLHKNRDGMQFPSKFLKIVTLSAHVHNYNTSIWHVTLNGIKDETYIPNVMNMFENNRETLAMRYILKHLRQRRYITTYKQLQGRSGVQLEDPLVSELYEMVVLRGDWVASEEHLRRMSAAGLLSEYIHSCTPRARWKRLRGTDANGDVPGRRGGHAMCMDVENELIYLFGGYDGQRSLDDFWVYNVREDRWRLLSHSVVEEKNGPTPRACHKMVFDAKNGCIYVLGRLGDSDFQEAKAAAFASAQGAEGDITSSESTQTAGLIRSAWSNRRSVGVATGNPDSTPAPQQQIVDTQPAARDYFSELYRYRTRGIDQGNWELLNHDTAIKGGPKLIYDHQLVLDAEAQVLYVQGGRVVDDEWKTPKYSGLYSYDLRTDKWTMLQTNASMGNFSPRFGHSMVFEPRQKKLFIFAGQKDEYLSDMWEYDIQTKTLTELFSNVTAVGGPEACFAQRAVIDPALKEIYVFAGVTRRHIHPSDSLPVSLYRYDTCPGTWMRVPTAESASRRKTSTPAQETHPSPKGRHNDDKKGETTASSPEIPSMEAEEEPIARRACQVVYDPTKRTFYVHGGTAQTGRVGTVDERLDDFWSMTLERPSPDEVIRRAILEIRKQQFREMCEDVAPISALAFLQNEVSAVVNHEDSEEAKVFRSLLTHLFAQSPAPLSPVSPRPSSSFDSPASSKSGSGEWTCELPGQIDEDIVMADMNTINATQPTFSVDDDPYELALRGGKRLSGARFTQRTEVFESLLRFINRKGLSKQPDGSLLDVVGNEEL